MFAVLLLFAICFASPLDKSRQLRKSNKALLEALKTLTEAESAVGEPPYCNLASACDHDWSRPNCPDTCGETVIVCSELLTCDKCVEAMNTDSKRVCDFKKQPEGDYKCVDAAGTKWSNMEVKDMYSCPKCQFDMEPISYMEGDNKKYRKATPHNGCLNWCYNYETNKMRWKTDCFADYKPSGLPLEKDVWGKCGPGGQCTTKTVKGDCKNNKENLQFIDYCPDN